MTQYASTSPYFSTPIKRFYLDTYVDRPVREDSGDRLIIIDDKYEFRPDLLAYDLYNDTRLWWVFYRRNMDVIKDPIFDFTAGKQIYVSSLEYITKALG